MDIQNVQQYFTSLLEQIQIIQDDQTLEAFRLEHLTRTSYLSELFTQMKSMSSEQKKIYGPLLNDLKKSLFDAYEHKKQELFEKQLEAQRKKEQYFDVTIDTYAEKGSLHPYTQEIEIIQNIFISMGFQIAYGPELETSFFNFHALNIPKHHPAYADSDTFWIDEEHLLRTQTSTVQIRTMLNQKPPIAIIAPGRTMRNEATDASHDFMFMQLEGLYINKDVSIANTLSVLQKFLATFFNKSMQLRVRPGYFPFVEPGFEIDATCPFCKSGCSVCKQTTWIELMGAGLVHPEVLKHCSIDPTEYSGFAFGMGLTRLIMLKYGITDIRLLHSSNLDFLKQF